MPLDDDAFRWIAEMPSITEVSKSSGVFPSLEDGVLSLDLDKGSPDASGRVSNPSIGRTSNASVSNVSLVSSHPSHWGADAEFPAVNVPRNAPSQLLPSVDTLFAKPTFRKQNRNLGASTLGPAIGFSALESTPPSTLSQLVNDALAPTPPPATTKGRAFGESATVNFDAVHDICDYFDAHTVKVDEDTALNISDMDEAARHLRLHPLSQLTVETLVQIGWRVPRYRAERNPWAQAAESFEREYQEREHENYVIELRCEQQALAEKLRRRLVFREYLRIWRDVLRTDVQVPKRVLARHDMQVVVPRYVRLWVLKTRLARLQRMTADELAATYSKRMGIEIFENLLKHVETLRSKGEELNKKTALAWALSMWTRRLRTVNTATKPFILRKYLTTWKSATDSVICARREARREFQQRVVRCWQHSLNAVQAGHERASKLAKARCVTLWRVRHFKHRFQRERRLDCVQEWRHKTLEMHARKIVEKSVKRQFIAQWRQQLEHVQHANERSTEIVECSNKFGEQLIIEVWNSRVRGVAAMNARSQDLGCACIRRKMLFVWRHELRRLDELYRTGRRFRTRAVYDMLSARAHALRDARLDKIIHHCSSLVLTRNVSGIIDHWRRECQREVHKRCEVVDIIQQYQKRAVLNDWRQKRSKLTHADEYARELRIAVARQSFLSLWRSRLEELHDLNDVREELKIARLAVLLRSQTRRWQLRSAAALSQQSQARRIRELMSRRVRFAIIGVWRDKLAYKGASSLFESPSKLSAVSPRLISKWRELTSPGAGLSPSTPQMYTPTKPNRRGRVL